MIDLQKFYAERNSITGLEMLRYNWARIGWNHYCKGNNLCDYYFQLEKIAAKRIKILMLG